MHYDLIIVGGGMVGASLALALRETPLRIALIDAALFKKNDQRLFALNYSSCQFLDQLGIWSSLHEYASPIQAVHVSRKGQFGAVRLNAPELELANLGHVVPAQYVEALLNERLASLANISIYRPATLKHLTQTNGIITLQLQSDIEELLLHAPMVIGADGTESTVRQQCGIPSTRIAYQQSALVTRTQLARPHQQIAYERFIDEGAIAMLPLAENVCASIWTAKDTTIADLMQLSDQSFVQCLQQQFGYRLGKLLGVQARHSFALHGVFAEKVVEGGVMLIGNAAHTVHPITAQGFNLALYEVAMLAERLQASPLLSQREVPHLLREVAERTAKRRSQVITASRAVAMRIPVCASGLGMALLDKLPPLKQQWMQLMTGRLGYVPVIKGAQT